MNLSIAQPHLVAHRGGTVYHLTEDRHPESGQVLGFWIYLMSDCLIFACLFACYGVLGRNYAGGPTGAQVFELPTVALNTALLLVSSITYGFSMVAMQGGRVKQTLRWLAATGLLGVGFLSLELKEFAHLIAQGAGPDRSAFLSSFFTLVGTHGLHVAFGVVWLVTLMIQAARRGFDPTVRRRLMCLSLFWHFLDVVWIGVFSFVYLLGAL
jgi:cytochrome o ubiquinol oxidase subunit 3